MTTIRIAIWICVFLFAITATLAQDTDIVVSDENGPAAGSIKLTEIASNFNRPVYLTHAGDGSNRLFVVEQKGKIWILDDGERVAQPFLDVSELISPKTAETDLIEIGLLSMAFHPDFVSNGIFFVSYTDLLRDNVVAKYRVSESDSSLADPDEYEVIFWLDQPHEYHNGGLIKFGPDGYLYIAIGDGGLAYDPLGSGQNLETLLGAILRIDVVDIEGGQPYAIPPDNPFAVDPNAQDEIWAYGLRNVWRFSFDRLTGDMFIADVGQDRWEEVNFQPAYSPGGENYGWNIWEGNNMPTAYIWEDNNITEENAPNHVSPIFEYAHNLGCAVIGGYVYRGEAAPDLQGAYIFGDHCSGRIWASWRVADMNWQTREIMNTDLAISSFGEDEANELYVIDLAGSLYRFDRAES